MLERIYTYNLAGSVEQRPAAVSRIDSGVGLYVGDTVGGLPDRADDPLGYGAFEAYRRSDGDDRLALRDLARITQRQSAVELYQRIEANQTSPTNQTD